MALHLGWREYLHAHSSVSGHVIACALIRATILGTLCSISKWFSKIFGTLDLKSMVKVHADCANILSPKYYKAKQRKSTSRSWTKCLSLTVTMLRIDFFVRSTKNVIFLTPYFQCSLFLIITTLLSWLKSTLLLKNKCIRTTIYMKTQC